MTWNSWSSLRNEATSLRFPMVPGSSPPSGGPGRRADYRAPRARLDRPRGARVWQHPLLVGPLLSLSGVSKSFAGVRALRGVSFDLRPGEVHALLGENGAGKSTLVRIVTGAHPPDEGEVQAGGKALDRADPLLARALGIAPIYQQPALFPELSVAENLAVGREPGGAWRRVDWGERRRHAEARSEERRVGKECRSRWSPYH